VIDHLSDRRIEKHSHVLTDFKDHIRMIRKYRILSLAELSEDFDAVSRGRTPAVIMTFDDGYLGNLAAAELLAGMNMPWTMFVSVAVVGRYAINWANELALLILHGDASNLELLGKKWIMHDARGREETLNSLRKTLKTMPSAVRQATMENLRAQFPPGNAQELQRKYPSLQMLEWSEIKELADAGTEIGSHGILHEIHHSGQPLELRRQELEQSREQLEKRLGRPCLYFAFPHGEANSRSGAEVRSAGYRLGFTTRARAIRADDDPLMLPRIIPPGRLSGFAQSFYWSREIS
jgi:peptidoglycan/xylan/chitin deacetylase (PgdA/CDA1 family)